jgi:hypothetical protein
MSLMVAPVGDERADDRRIRLAALERLRRATSSAAVFPARASSDDPVR